LPLIAAARVVNALAGPLAALERAGRVLLHDAALPSLTTIVAGEPVRGSWWGHRAGSAIFDVASALEEHPDVLVSKLVRGKVTFVHRRLVPALVAVGSQRAEWQLAGLAAAAAELLARLDALGGAPLRAGGEAAKVLERRLLVHGRQVHTAEGRHATELAPWSVVARERDVGPLPGEAAARAELEAAARGLGVTATLPWW
jgi:hypothetical protein